jgi:hypothetical protein
MKFEFPLFQSHLDLAHFWWARLVTPSDTVIDMTCGNGHDTKVLSTLNPKRLIAIDIQPQALERAKLLAPDAEFFLKDHSQYPDELEDKSVKLAVYNLGWLPGSDKSCTTLATTTLKSVFSLMPKIVSGGLISLTCYPGHAEGKKEEDALLDALKGLQGWSVCYHTWVNKKAAPSLILLQAAL